MKYFGGRSSGGGAVTSVFGRIGAVVAALGDYAASLVNNDSSVAGTTVKDALNTLKAASGVSSVFSRTGAVVAALNDYAASLINNDSSVTGATVKDALNTLLAAIPSVVKFDASWGTVAAAGVATARWLGRNGSLTGVTTAPPGEYPAPIAGTFTFTLTVRVSGTKLTTDSVAFEIYKNGAATGVTLTMAPADTTKQASGLITVAVGDGISVRTLQTSTEAQAAWNANANVRAT